MGYLISAHIVREEPSIERLRKLPASIGHRVYHHQAANVYLVDAFRASRPPAYPFQTTVPAADIPLELSAELDVLESVYGYLNKVKLGNTFKKSYINFALLLNSLLEVPVFSFISDDDEWDFACVVRDGALERLKCRCGDLTVTHEGNSTQIQPLMHEEAEEDYLTDIGELKAALPGVSVLDRNVAWDLQLHAVAIEEWRRFNQSDDVILGLGSFDPPEDEPQWKLID